ncbi:MAG TPA: Hsp20/alpha crystallin family protein [Vicinamibacteria bacterium]|nr:Hsp20/alpha crystallin family protein [Vicinamibacteria bacterium]
MLQRWYPLAELRQMQEAANRLWGGAGPTPETAAGMERWSIPLDVVEEGANIVIHASLPGVNREDIEVAIDDDILTIKGHTNGEPESKEGTYLLRERTMGTFHRSLRLPDTVDAEKATASYKDGILTTTFPKLEVKKARALKIGIGT